MASFKTLESKIQAHIIRQLKASGYLVVKIGLCSLPGFPDIMALKDGRIKFVEVKRPGEKSRPLQEFRHRQLRELGFDVEVSCDNYNKTKL